MKLDLETRRQETELRNDELKKNYELQVMKADMAHQHKIAEFDNANETNKFTNGERN
ncbi:10820_t:CDS:1, partial [Ambispora leptoticha]